MNVFTIIMNWYDRLPFCGKYVTRPLAFSVYYNNGIKKVIFTIVAVIVLTFLAYQHGVQVAKAINTMIISSSIIIDALSLIYICANILASVAQLYLLYRIIRNAVKNEKCLGNHRIPIYSNKQLIGMLLFTGTCQFAFMFVDAIASL